MVLTLVHSASSSLSSVRAVRENTGHRTYRGSLIKLRPEFEERYIILHRHTFPGVLSRIRASHIRNYSIFLRDGTLFSHLEYIGVNYDADMKAMADTVTRDWWKLTDPMQEPLETRKEGEWWASMDLLLHLDGAPASVRTRRTALVAVVKISAEKILQDACTPPGKEILVSLKKARMHNVNFYFRDGRLYAYFEYTGTRGDPEDAWGTPDVRQWLRSIEACCESDGTVWKPMKEVFHTN